MGSWVAADTSIKGRLGIGNKMLVYGEVNVDSGDTGGAIVTGLTDIDFFHCTGATKPPTWSGGTATVTMGDPGATLVAFWFAFGRE